MRRVELQVLAGGGIAGPLQELATPFEATGHRLHFRFGTTPQLIELATSGTPCDLAVVPADVMQHAGARARFVAGPTTDIARAGLAVAVRAGAPRPDISTPAALKRTLLAAGSIATIPASATGTLLAQVFDRLGIDSAMAASIRVQPNPGAIVQAVAQGECELALFLHNVLAAPGLDVIGPFPAELQQEVVFTSAVAVDAQAPDAAGAFIDHLTAPPARALLRARGMSPG